MDRQTAAREIYRCIRAGEILSGCGFFDARKRLAGRVGGGRIFDRAILDLQEAQVLRLAKRGLRRPREIILRSGRP